MDEEIEVPQPASKISDAVAILIGLFNALLDAIDLIPIAGDITDVVAAPMGFYYWMNGISATGFIVAEILDLIPGIQEIPSRTIAWIIIVWLDRHPKIEAKLGTAIEIGNAIEGNFGGAEGGLEAEAQLASAGNTTLNVADAESGALTAEENGGGGKPETNARPSETSTERGSAGNDLENGPDENDTEAERNARAEQKAANELRLGDEVSPGEQMEEQNFGALPDEPAKTEPEEIPNEFPASSAPEVAEPQPGNNVVDIAAAAKARESRKEFIRNKIPENITSEDAPPEDLAA